LCESFVVRINITAVLSIKEWHLALSNILLKIELYSRFGMWKIPCHSFFQFVENQLFVFQALEMGAVDILIVWENLEIHRIVLKNHQTDGKSGSIFYYHIQFNNM